MRAAVLIASSLLVAASACTQERIATCPEDSGEGLIQGTVALGGIPAETWIEAMGGADFGSNERDFRIRASSDGSYALVIPPGAYVLSAGVDSKECCQSLPVSWYRRAGPPYLSSTRDTIQVTAGSPVSADFSLASLVMAVRLPSGLRNAYVSLTLVPHESRILGSFQAARTVSGPSEILEIPGLQPDLYRLQVEIGGYGRATQQFWLPATRDSSQGAWVEVTAGQAVPASFSFPDLPARFEGRITGSWQHFGARPEIVLVSRDSLVVATIPIDSDDGSFQSEIYYPVPVKMTIDIHDVPRWYGGRSFEDASVIDLRPGETAPTVEVVESGVVLDLRETNRFDDSFWVAQVEFVDPQSLVVVQQVTVSRRGRETLRPVSNLDPGDYLLHVFPLYGNPPLLEQWYDGSSGPEGARVVTVPDSGGIAQVQINLALAGREAP